MNHEPIIVLIGTHKEVFQKKLPASDTTEVNFESLKLENGTYHIIIKDTVSPRISEFFTIGENTKIIK
jgi:hypothetical protein